MTKVEKIVAIEFTYAVTHAQSQSRVKTKNATHLGFFQPLYDSEELKKEGKYRFIPTINNQKFQKLVQHTDKSMTDEQIKKELLATSIVLGIEEIENIDQIIP